MNRGQSINVGVGGKGQDVLIALSCMELNFPLKPILLQFLGSGPEGDYLLSLLTPKIEKLSGVSASIRTATPCRTCITLVDRTTSEVTEIIEPSGIVLPREIEAMLESVSGRFAEQQIYADGVSVMGSMPPGCSPELYASIIRQSCGPNSKVIFLSSQLLFLSPCFPCPALIVE